MAINPVRYTSTLPLIISSYACMNVVYGESPILQSSNCEESEFKIDLFRDDDLLHANAISLLQYSLFATWNDMKSLHFVLTSL